MEAMVLASASPRRHALVAQLGLNARIQAADIDESVQAGEQPGAYVERLARGKAQAIAHSAPGCWVLGADTSVVIDGAILGKPTDRAHAAQMLGCLAGRRHQVYTGIAVVAPEGSVSSHVDVSVVEIVALSAAQIHAYWDTGEPADKAGGYAVQGIGGQYVSRIEGCFYNVMGLPLAATMALLSKAGFKGTQ